MLTSPTSSKNPPTMYEIIDIVASGLINKNKPIITNNIDIASDVLKLLLIFPSIFTSILNTFFILFH